MRRALICTALLLAAVASGCAAPRLAPDARGIAFPEPASSYRKDGIVVAPQTLALLQPGLRKDQLRQMLGLPHFSEGLFGVQDWNYLVDFRRPEGTLRCQLQLQFEGVTSTGAFWRSEECTALAAASGGTALAGAPAAPAAAAPETRSEDRLVFPFGRSDLDDLEAPDRQRLEALAADIARQPASIRRITVTGHADRIGSDERKQARALARARTVAEVFTASGIDPARIEVIGRSDAEPITRCPPGFDAPQMETCLAPDRRVTVRVERQ